MLIIDFGLQGLHITNQHILCELELEARSRMNAVYMTTDFIGAASGSPRGSLAWLHGGWQAICLLSIVLALLSGRLLIYDERLVLASGR